MSTEKNLQLAKFAKNLQITTSSNKTKMDIDLCLSKKIPFSSSTFASYFGSVENNQTTFEKLYFRIVWIIERQETSHTSVEREWYFSELMLFIFENQEEIDLKKINNLIYKYERLLIEIQDNKKQTLIKINQFTEELEQILEGDDFKEPKVFEHLPSLVQNKINTYLNTNPKTNFGRRKRSELLREIKKEMKALKLSSDCF